LYTKQSFTAILQVQKKPHENISLYKQNWPIKSSQFLAKKKFKAPIEIKINLVFIIKQLSIYEIRVKK
jgi:hypothetical protein